MADNASDFDPLGIHLAGVELGDGCGKWSGNLGFAELAKSSRCGAGSVIARVCEAFDFDKIASFKVNQGNVWGGEDEDAIGFVLERERVDFSRHEAAP